jgi:putative ABC transport system permease protein
VFAQQIHKGVGDTVAFDSKNYRVVGLYSTGNAFGNSTVMFPLSTLQGLNHVSGQVSLGFAKVAPGASIKKVRAAIDKQFVQLTTIQTAQDYGRADRNLTLISAADTGGSILAALIAITGVLNTSLMSFFERIREFGIVRSVGWSRRRVLSMVLGETLVVSLVGAVLGLLGGWVAVNLLQNLSQLRGVFEPTYSAWVFARALMVAVVVAFLGALYPASRAALMAPMEALRRE